MTLSPIRFAWLLAAMMALASIAALLARPARMPEAAARAPLARVVPARAGAWREVPLAEPAIVNPRQQEMIDRSYSEVLTRAYVNEAGYLLMLSVAYGADQRAQEAHFPEVCYPAQGFVLEDDGDASLQTRFGLIPVRRLFATLGSRREPLTYWFVLGETAVQGKLDRRLADLRYGLSGRVPDGLLFRVSSLDPDRQRAYRMHEAFIADVLAVVDAAAARRLAGAPPSR